MSIATPNGSTPCFGRKSNPSPRMSEAIPGGAGAEMQSPRIELEQCVFDQGLQAPVRALQLQWEADGDANAERAWHMPDGVMLKGPAPRRFGITIIRVADNSYKLCVLWNRMSLRWEGLTRAQIMASSLSAILTAIRTDLWHLLSQPVEVVELAA